MGKTITTYLIKGIYDISGSMVLKDNRISDKSTNSLSWRDKRAKMVKEYTDRENGLFIPNDCH